MVTPHPVGIKIKIQINRARSPLCPTVSSRVPSSYILLPTAGGPVGAVARIDTCSDLLFIVIINFNLMLFNDR